MRLKHILYRSLTTIMETIQDKYKQLLEDESLYNQSLLYKYRTTNSFWETETWQLRELAFRHFTTCVLLSNTEFTDEVAEIIKEEVNAQIGEDAPMEEVGEVADVAIDEDSQEFIPFPDLDSSDDEGDTFRDEIHNKMSLLGNQAKYRYIVIEGHPSEKQLQASFTTMWRSDMIQKKFDIIDTKEKKFIEVKVSVNTYNRITEYEIYKNNSTALIVCDPCTTEIHLVDKEERMPGETKVRAFLTKRKILLHQLSDETYTEDVDLEKLIFSNSRLNESLSTYRTLYTANCDMKQDLTFPESVAKIDVFKCSELFRLLTKPTQRFNSPFVQWKGKLLPISLKSYRPAFERDSDTIDDFFNHIEGGISELDNDEDSTIFLKWLLETWDKSEENTKNFHLFSVNKSTQKSLPDGVKNMLGIGKKKLIQGIEENMKQDEFTELQERRYHKWFERVYKEMAEEHTEFNGHQINMDIDESVEEIPSMILIRGLVEKVINL